MSYKEPKASLVEGLRARIVELEAQANTNKSLFKELASEKEQLAVTLRSIGDGVITTDVEGRVVLLNPVAEKLTGWTLADAATKMLREIFHIINEKTGKDVENPVQKVLDTGLIRGLANHTILIAKDGTTRVIADSAAPIFDTFSGKILGVVLVFRDITNERKMELEIAKAQKLESVGILAGGIAHDFNNILTSVAGNIWMAKLASKSNPNLEVTDLLVEAEKQIFRAKELTQQLLTFAKGGIPVKKITSLKALLEESVRFVLHGSNVRCIFNLPEGLWMVNIDAGQISQVINNLVINADQAMPEGGILTISAENILVGQDVEKCSLPLKAIDYVKVSIKDQGIGISQIALAKIFDPYFTTKSRGSGLGLATAFSIVRKHEGFIEVESEIDQGTSFFLYLPASSEKEVLPKETDNPETELLPGHGGKVLLVDDEQPILNLLKRALGLIGYEVITAQEGTIGVALYRQAFNSDKPFQGVILDLTIPGGMGGKETIQKLLEIDPQVKALVTSGYSDDPVISRFNAYGFKGAVVKPFRFLELREKLDAMLAP